MAAPLPNLDGVLASIIQTYLHSATEPLCVFENALADPGDGWLQRTLVPFFTTSVSVYHHLTNQDQESETIRKTLARAKSIWPPLIGILTHSHSFSSQLEKGVVQDSTLREMATQTEQLVVGAYDGEGFLLWSK